MASPAYTITSPSADDFMKTFLHDVPLVQLTSKHETVSKNSLVPRIVLLVNACKYFEHIRETNLVEYHVLIYSIKFLKFIYHINPLKNINLKGNHAQMYMLHCVGGQSFQNIISFSILLK